MNVYEMEGFLRGKCLTGDLLVGESHAAYLVRKLNESATLKADRDAQQKRADALAVENAELKGSVENAAGCINAAYAEGLIDVLAESADERLVDLVRRRLLFTYLPAETPVTNEILVSMGDHVLLEQLEDGRKFIVRQSEIIANQEQRISVVVAENANLMQLIDSISDLINGPNYHDDAMECGLDGRGITGRYEAMRYGWDEALDRVCVEISQRNTPETPATNAAIEARGVEKAIELLLNKFSGTGHIGVPVMALESLAIELREAK